jgi:hypothetical protein
MAAYAASWTGRPMEVQLMSRVQSVFLITVLSFVLIRAAAGQVVLVDLGEVLGNSDFEDDLVHSQWTATVKGTGYQVGAPVVNPAIVPKNASMPLEAPSGDHFIGVENPDGEDIKGRLVHDAVAGVFAQGTVFEVTVFANRGRLDTASTAAFGKTPSEVTLQLFGWGAGSVPVVNPNTDNWSRRPSVTLNQAFTQWGPNGEWAAQLLQFVTPKALAYIALAVTDKNHTDVSYVAFDLE